MSDRVSQRARILPSKIHVVIRRSTDNGATWSEPVIIAEHDKGYSGPSLAVDRKTGAILSIFNGLNDFFQSTPENPQRHFFCRSTDNGGTLTEPIEFTSQIYEKGCAGPERAT